MSASSPSTNWLRAGRSTNALSFAYGMRKKYMPCLPLESQGLVDDLINDRQRLDFARIAQRLIGQRPYEEAAPHEVPLGVRAAHPRDLNRPQGRIRPQAELPLKQRRRLGRFSRRRRIRSGGVAAGGALVWLCRVCTFLCEAARDGALLQRPARLVVGSVLAGG